MGGHFPAAIFGHWLSLDQLSQRFEQQVSLAVLYKMEAALELDLSRS
jgi:hypothetical protein